MTMTITREHLTAAVDAAMVEMQNISPPMRRSECERLIKAALSAQPTQEAEPVACACGDQYPPSSYGAGFIDGSGMCQNCDAAIPARDIAPPHNVEPMELTPELADILGRPCFTLIHMAQALRLTGRDIPKRAEDEQAHCIHWMLCHYMKHGAGWRDHALAELNEAKLRYAPEPVPPSTTEADTAHRRPNPAHGAPKPKGHNPEA